MLGDCDSNCAVSDLAPAGDDDQRGRLIFARSPYADRRQLPAALSFAPIYAIIPIDQNIHQHA